MQLDLLFERLMCIVCELVWDHKFATCLLIIKKCETILGKCTFSSNEYFKESHNMIFYTRSSHNMCCSCVKQGTYKVRNEIETKRNETKRNQRKRNEIIKNETKRNEINEMKTK